MSNKLNEFISSSELKNEFRIILWAISGTSSGSTLNKKMTDIVNWDDLIQLAQNHGVISFLYHRLKGLKEELVPPEIMSRLKNIYLQIVRFNMIQANQLVKVLSILKENKVRVVPIKGPVISQQAYGDIGYRTFQDLDLLIKPEDFIKTYDLLINEGYETAIKFSGKWKKLWKRFRRDVEFRNGKTLIDLHQRFSQGHSSFDLTDEQLGRAGAISILDKEISILSVEDTILYLCINGTKDQWNKLRMVSELASLIRTHPDINWKRIIDDAKKRGILLMVLSGFQFLSEITGVQLANQVISEIEKDNRVKVLSEKYLPGIFSEFPDKKEPAIVRSIFNTMDSVSDKIRFISYYFFTPGASDLRFLKLPDILSPLYYIIRPLRLIGSLLFSSKKRMDE